MKRRIFPLLFMGVPTRSQNSMRFPVPVWTFTMMSETTERSLGSGTEGGIVAPAVVVPDDLPQLLLAVVREGEEGLEGLLVDVDVLVVVGMVGVARKEADLDGPAQLPAIVREGQAVGTEVVVLLVGVAAHPRVHGRDQLHAPQALPFVLGHDAVEAEEVVEREVRARDGVGALGGGDATYAPEPRDVHPGVVVLGVRGGPVGGLVAIGEQRDAAGLEGSVHLGAARDVAPFLAEHVAVVLVVLGLRAEGERDALGPSLVVEGQLLAAIPVGVVEAGLAAVSLPTAYEVPGQLGARLGVSRAVDLLHEEGLPRAVVDQAVLGPELRLPEEALRGVAIHLGGFVVPVGRTDLEAHALVEEEVAIRPELRRQVGLQLLDLIERDEIAFLEGGHAGSGIFLGSHTGCHQHGTAHQADSHPSHRRSSFACPEPAHYTSRAEGARVRRSSPCGTPFSLERTSMS
jgi:hypothetical protein